MTTKQFQIKGTAQTEGAIRGIDAVEKSLNKARTASEAAGVSFDKSGKSSQSMASQLMGARSAALGYAAATAGLAIGLDAVFERTRKVANVYANLPFAITQARDATNNMVDSLKLATLANQAHRLGVAKTGQAFADVTELAMKLGLSVGRDVPDAVERMILGLGKGEQELLDELGIVTKAADAHKIYAEQIGKTVSQLTEAEKTQGVMSVRLAEARRKAAEVTLEVNGMASAWQRAKIEFIDWYDTHPFFNDTAFQQKNVRAVTDALKENHAAMEIIGDAQLGDRIERNIWGGAMRFRSKEAQDAWKQIGKAVAAAGGEYSNLTEFLELYRVAQKKATAETRQAQMELAKVAASGAFSALSAGVKEYDRDLQRTIASYEGMEGSETLIRALQVQRLKVAEDLARAAGDEAKAKDLALQRDLMMRKAIGKGEGTTGKRGGKTDKGPELQQRLKLQRELQEIELQLAQGRVSEFQAEQMRFAVEEKAAERQLAAAKGRAAQLQATMRLEVARHKAAISLSEDVQAAKLAEADLDRELADGARKQAALMRDRQVEELDFRLEQRRFEIEELAAMGALGADDSEEGLQIQIDRLDRLALAEEEHQMRMIELADAGIEKEREKQKLHEMQANARLKRMDLEQRKFAVHAKRQQQIANTAANSVVGVTTAIINAEEMTAKAIAKSIAAYMKGEAIRMGLVALREIILGTAALASYNATGNAAGHFQAAGMAAAAALAWGVGGAAAGGIASASKGRGDDNRFALNDPGQPGTPGGGVGAGGGQARPEPGGVPVSRGGPQISAAVQSQAATAPRSADNAQVVQHNHFHEGSITTLDDADRAKVGQQIGEMTDDARGRVR